jgi:hypothetical protein
MILPARGASKEQMAHAEQTRKAFNRPDKVLHSRASLPFTASVERDDTTEEEKRFGTAVEQFTAEHSRKVESQETFDREWKRHQRTLGLPESDPPSDPITAERYLDSLREEVKWRQGGQA